MRTLPLLLLLACGPARPDVTGSLTPSGDPSLAPFPFSVAQLRAYNVDGRVWTLRVEAPGRDPMTRTLAFSRGDENGAWVRSTVGPVGGEPEEVTETFQLWSELQRHAAYPAARAAIAWGRADGPEGARDCVEYVVEDPPAETVACFDPERPGPPLRLEERRDGRSVVRVQVVGVAP